MKEVNKNKNQISKDIDQMLLSQYLINKIGIINESFDLILSEIQFVRSFFSNNPIKKKKWAEKDILRYLKKKDKDQIDNIVDLISENTITTLDEIIENKIKLLGYGYNGEDDKRDIIRHEIEIRKELEEELFSMASYLKEKLEYKFIKKRISKKDNLSLNLLIKSYNKSLAKLKYVFYKI